MGSWTEEDLTMLDDSLRLCEGCAEYTHECPYCGRITHQDDSWYLENADERVCESCYDERRTHYDDDDYDERDYVDDSEESPDPKVSEPDPDNEAQLWLPKLPERDSRLVSFEQELIRGGRNAAEVLWEAGLSVVEYPAMFVTTTLDVFVMLSATGPLTLKSFGAGWICRTLTLLVSLSRVSGSYMVWFRTAQQK